MAASRRPRGVLVIEPAAGDEVPVHEYPKADRWELEERKDGDWLHIFGKDGEQLASFRPGTYDRPEAAH